MFKRSCSAEISPQTWEVSETYNHESNPIVNLIGTLNQKVEKSNLLYSRTPHTRISLSSQDQSTKLVIKKKMNIAVHERMKSRTTKNKPAL